VTEVIAEIAHSSVAGVESKLELQKITGESA
jgi:hypothetical protein